MKSVRTAVAGIVAAVGLAMAAGSGVVSAADPAPATWETQADMAGIVRFVPPLKHPFPKHWQPTLFWWQAPLSFDNPAKLKRELKELAARGLLPCISLSAEYNVDPKVVDKEVAAAKAMAKAGFPVNIQMAAALDLYRLPDGKVVCHPDSPDAGKKGDVGEEFACLLLKAGWTARADHIRGLMKKFADAKVPVAGVWYDYEGYPYVWNGMMGHIARCPSCRKEFSEIPALQRKELPPLSDGFDLYVAWAANFWAEAVTEGLAKPVRKVFPSAKIGFYGFTLSSAAYPTGGSTTNPAEIDVVQPVCYAETKGGANIPQKEMDQGYFLGLLGTVTGVAKNLRPNQLMMPFVCGYCDADQVTPCMTRNLYREFLRHAILRGAQGFYCFNTAPPYTPMVHYYSELADINAVYNELFAYRDFLEGGETLNQDWITPLTSATAKADWRETSMLGTSNNTNTWSRGAIVNGLRVWLPTPKVKDASVWSGLRKGDKALIRVVTLGEKPVFMNVTPFPGVTVRLLASPAGTTYVVSKSGAIRAVE